MKAAKHLSIFPVAVIGRGHTVLVFPHSMEVDFGSFAETGTVTGKNRENKSETMTKHM